MKAKSADVSQDTMAEFELIELAVGDLESLAKAFRVITEVARAPEYSFRPLMDDIDGVVVN